MPEALISAKAQMSTLDPDNTIEPLPLDRTGGDGFESQRLKKTANKITVESTGKVLVARVITGIFGFILVVYGLVALVAGEGILSLGVAAVGGVALYAAKFVKQQRRITIILGNGGATENGNISVNDIVQIELIKKYVVLPDVSDTSIDGFDCYEVNVRVTSGKRFMLLNHGNWRSIQRDTNLLQLALKKNVVTGGGCRWESKTG